MGTTAIKPETKAVLDLLGQIQYAALQTEKGEELYVRYLKFGVEPDLSRMYFIVIKDPGIIKEICENPAGVITADFLPKGGPGHKKITINCRLSVSWDSGDGGVKRGLKVLMENSGFAGIIKKDGLFTGYMLVMADVESVQVVP